jgi:hypothetical protein
MRMPNWIHWFLTFGFLAVVYSAAQAGDLHAKQAFPMLAALRALAVMVIAMIMNSAWYERRGLIVNVVHFCVEVAIILALIYAGHYLVVMLSILMLSLYEFARGRVAPAPKAA